MRAIDLSAVSWRKSSYSNTSGGDCLEVSDDLLRAADWHRSSYSNSDGGNCVEVAPGLPLVPVRDSKDPARGALLFAGPAWVAFLDGVRREAAGRAA
ncbi:DUF397 domain-containing protein [Streptomyces violaceorubidus]|uniref:DUF397 domain-containing protein n=1 Tax=Streptomyces violaceorubidus TaxID=284042 RepID=A0ABV1T476_9ACTN